MTPEAYLPEHLADRATAITPVSSGMSGATVYLVEVGLQKFVLKVAADNANEEQWLQALFIQRQAAEARLTPKVVHVDSDRHAVLTEFVEDQSFFSSYANPTSRQDALSALATTIRRVHALSPPAGIRRSDPAAFLATIWPQLEAVVPPFVADAVHAALHDVAPEGSGEVVLSHNDMNPSNLLYQDRKVMLLDWDAAGLNEPLYDVATVALFFRMDEATVKALLSAYQGHAVSAMPERFSYFRRIIALLCGTAILHASRKRGHPRAIGTETVATTPTLAEYYEQMRSGAVDVSTPVGQWLFGLSLIETSLGQ